MILRNKARFISVCFCVFFCMITNVYGETLSVEHFRSSKKWTGDFDGMVDRGVIRILTPYNKMYYFIDRGQHQGVVVDTAHQFEKYIHKQIKSKIKPKIVFIPMPRHRLIPLLNEGRGDVIMANLTVTKERKRLVDFSIPTRKDVKEIFVTHKRLPKITALKGLSGKTVCLRKSSSYFEHMKQLNQKLKQNKLKPVKIIPMSEHLEDADLIEMVNSKLLPMIVVDDHKAEFWAQIFKNIRLHPDFPIHEGGQIALAFRKKSPQLAAIINPFVKRHRKGTLFGNVIHKRYLENNEWVKNALAPDEIKKFDRLKRLFRQYADKYQLDYLMTGALAYQESKLDHSKKSHRGAVGVMQVLPSTAATSNVNIPDIDKLENNIHAGHKYLRFIFDRYFKSSDMTPLDRYLFTFAAYNAGPRRVIKLRQEAEKNGLNPNIWFQNVEVIAARRIGNETVQYVSNIYKYYLSYKLSLELLSKREQSLKLK